MFVVIVWWGGIGARIHPCRDIIHVLQVALVERWVILGLCL